MFYRYGAVALLLFAVTIGTTVAAPPVLTPQAGVIVLRNGSVLVGEITRLGDRYVVAFGERGEIFVDRHEIEFQCDSLEEAYFIKRDTINPRSAQEHVRLAQWCLKHRLLARAADQILAATVVDPNEPKLAAIQRQLEVDAAPSRAMKPLVANRSSRDQLEQMQRVVENLPTAVVHHFTTAVQPILLNRCSNAGCHGVRSNSGFQLLRAPHGTVMNRRFTHRNLYATLKLIDRASPGKSPLLNVPSSPHGNTAGAIFGRRDQRLYEQLADWVKRVSLGKTLPPATIEEPNSVLLQPLDDPGKIPLEARFFDDVKKSKLEGSDNPGFGEMLLRDSKIKKSFTPRDPFDPEIFNRRFHANKKSANKTAGGLSPRNVRSQNASPQEGGRISPLKQSPRQ